MIKDRHIFLGRLRLVLALLAVGMFVSAPFLVLHHHHSDILENTHCAACLLSTAHVTCAHNPIEPVPQVASIGRLFCADEALVSNPSVHTRNERAPPVA